MNVESEWIEEPEGGSPFTVQLLSMATNPLGVVRRRWIWMVSSLLLGAAGTAIAASTVVPIFLAEATVMVSSQQIPEEFVRSTVRGLDSLSNVNSLMGEVLSQRRMVKLIEQLDLYATQRERTPLDGVIRAMRGNIEIQKQQNLAKGAQGRQIETSSIYSISFTYHDPALASAVANALASAFVDANIEARSEQAEVTTDFLRRQLVRAESDLRVSNQRITEFRQTNRGSMPEDQDALLSKIDRVDQQRQSLIMRITEGEDRLAELHVQSRKTTPEMMLTELRLQLAGELASHTDEHPNVIALRRRVRGLEAEVSEINELLADNENPERAQIAASERELVRLRDQLEQIQATIVALDVRISRVPENQEKLAAFEERGAVLRETYVEFLRKVQDAELAEKLESSQQGSKASILDRARVPSSPIRSPTMLVIIGGLASLAAALGAGIAIELLLDPVVLSPAHLEAIGQPPLLGTIHTFG